MYLDFMGEATPKIFFLIAIGIKISKENFAEQSFTLRSMFKMNLKTLW